MVKIKKNREDKMEKNRRSLLNAAIEVVGENGYASASIKKITSTARVSHGTFYNYFYDRQNLFDQLLPAMGERLLSHIKAHLDDQLHGLEREKKRLEAYFDFFKKNPGFLRILSEAEAFAPKAHRQHVQRFYEDYMRALNKSLDCGELGNFLKDELPAIVFMLMGIRTYFSMLVQQSYISNDRLTIENLVSIYGKLMGNGFFIR
jgi:AcrR family transcriptional regulator